MQTFVVRNLFIVQMNLNTTRSHSDRWCSRTVVWRPIPLSYADNYDALTEAEIPRHCCGRSRQMSLHTFPTNSASSLLLEELNEKIMIPLSYT